MTQQIVLQENNGKPLIEVKDNGPTFMQLLAVALERNAAIDVIERLAALQEKQTAQRSLIEFNQALNRVQQEIKRIAPDGNRSDGKGKWASYAAIDRVIRPIYSKEGFTLSFSHADSPKPDHLRLVCRLALGAHVERPWVDMPIDPKGPKGGDVMTLPDATKAADSNAKRYLVKDIFNIAIGEEDAEGNAPAEQWLQTYLDLMNECQTLSGLRDTYKHAYEDADKRQDTEALKRLVVAMTRNRKRFQKPAEPKQ